MKLTELLLEELESEAKKSKRALEQVPDGKHDWKPHDRSMAFGYLAAQYGLTQVGITGLSPDEEPNPATLARVTDFVRTNKVRTIYYETLINPAIARTVASETGARTLVLDPIEGITDQSEGNDYFMIMRSNLENLKEGQPCP